MRAFTDEEHGTYNRYKNGLCRCVSCTEANRSYMETYRMALKWRAVGTHVQTEAQLHNALTKPGVFWW
jgi:hypothetical protein